jgi:hypothetical protein
VRIRPSRVGGKGVTSVKRFKIMVLVIFRLTLLISLVGIPVAHGVPRQERLKVTPGQLESGVVDEGQVITVTATVENRGTSTVEITNVRTN